MIGTFNRVSIIFRQLTSSFLPQIYVNDGLVDDLNLKKDEDCCISISRLYRGAGRNSGLAVKIKELFGKNSKWMSGWIIMRHLSHGWFQIKDFFFKK